MAGPPPPSPAGNGGFDIQPVHVYHASDLVRDGQYQHDERAVALVGVLNRYNQSAGTGWAADEFADEYQKVAAKFLEAWGRGVVSIGGASVGLTVTANHYVLADWEADGRKGAQPTLRPEPVVISSAPPYGPVNPIKWSGTGEDVDSWWISGALGEAPDFLADVIRPAIEDGLRLGKVHEITPGIKEDETRDMAKAWRKIGSDAVKSSDEFNDAIATITNPKDKGEWQAAMRAFGQTIWGTTAWGRQRGADGARAQSGGREWRTTKDLPPSGRRPVIDVLKKTADAVAAILDRLSDVGEKTTEFTEQAGINATKATVRDLTTGLDWRELTKLAVGGIVVQVVLTFRSHMDKEGVDAVVENYHRAFDEAAGELRALLPELELAILSAPTYHAEAARAQGFGARSLNEFKKEHSWQRGGESPFPYLYSLDLATNEGLGGGHTLDKHVGKTDAQLVQRIEDEQRANGKYNILTSSSFTDLDSAQKYTQYNVRENTPEIQDWLKNPPPPKDLVIGVPSVPHEGPLTGSAVTGRTVQVVDGKVVPAADSLGVTTRLKYDPNLNPPFVVYTSAPE
ncbi:RNase A-like domain-containing protein [Streptomyces adelaidensis]|uniref:RNase A-like domain-containing protein n=1 Tax=Streptomyces adelaidensis TaxID=2796465 RepID=UPI0019065C20|nr:RNase A-like domain-containing protein [Streptomyces adelaidensis]